MLTPNSFNRVDWKETRDSLLIGIKALEGDNSSTVGKWATVEILRATGEIDDANRAEKLAEWLTRDRKKFPGWSRIKDYCEVDPCDPDAKKPSNVAATAKQYRAIQPSKLATQMGQGSEDHFFAMARTGVTRFHIDDAVIAHRALADDILGRADLARRQGALTLLAHSAVLTDQQALALLKAGQASTATLDDQRANRDEWLTAQYFIFTAIAHLQADKQLEAIAGIEGNSVFLDILDALLPASAEATERVLEEVLQSKEIGKHKSVLAAIRHSRPPLSSRSRAIIEELFKSSDARVRAQALGVSAINGDPGLLKTVIESGWDARLVRGGKQTFERWYGSSAILKAAEAGLIPLDEALDRMDLDHYGFSAQALGATAAKVIAKRVETALISALGYKQAPDLPEMATSTPHAASSSPPLISLNDPPPSHDIRDQFNRLGETSEQFDARQDRMASSFESFTKELTTADANLILSDLTLEGVKALVDADEDAGKRWIAMLNVATDVQLSHLHHVATQLTVALAKNDVAKELLKRLARVDPAINRFKGIAKVPSESLALWGNTDTPELRAICKHRLVTRRDDGKIALEVFAAYENRKSEIVEETIHELLAKDQPADTCLALTLAGFCDQSAFATSILTRFDGVQGYMGIAQKAANEAYRRNLWARAWYEQMRTAKTPLEFWQASVLLTKIVDLRFDIWAGDLGAETDICRAFLPTVLREIGRRIEKWQKKRKDHLFGDKLPALFFLPDEAPA